ncbi:MAG: hypothetical protein SFW35_11940 [Chitinophagales bacterium]|nr:hypothetical protein [Chitinophagales bacterium]
MFRNKAIGFVVLLLLTLTVVGQQWHIVHHLQHNELHAAKEDCPICSGQQATLDMDWAAPKHIFAANDYCHLPFIFINVVLPFDSPVELRGPPAMA